MTEHRKDINQKQTLIFDLRYILDSDQPTTCPKCGTRTDFEQFEEDGTMVQKHHCLNLNCAFVFLGEFENEMERKTY